MPSETDLYAPVKALLEKQGYDVKGEVRGCDVVGVRGDEPPVIVELKKAFGLGLVLQGIDRLGLSDTVYLAVGAWPKRMREVKKLCRRLGLGFMVVTKDRVDVLLDPVPYQPRKNARKAKRLLGEALRCAGLLSTNGPMKLALLRATAQAPNAATILRRDAYGWFERVERGIYHITPQGLAGLERFGWKKE